MSEKLDMKVESDISSYIPGKGSDAIAGATAKTPPEASPAEEKFSRAKQ